MDARVHASGDKGLDLQALACQGRSPSPSPSSGVMPRASLRENVVPEELPLGQSFIVLSHQELRCVRREARRARAASVPASYSAMMDWLGVPKARLKWSMRLAAKAGSATPSAVRRPSPPQVTPVVACHQE